MCGLDLEQLKLIEARQAAEEIIQGYLRLPLRKAMDLGSPQGFDRAVTVMASSLRAKASGAEQEAVHSAIEALDVDWRQTTAVQRRTLISQSLIAAGRKTERVPKLVQVVFDDAAEEVVKVSRNAARMDLKLGIGFPPYHGLCRSTTVAVM